jgi:CBS domain-containing protein
MIRSPKLLGPETTIAQVRVFFDDDHVHAALIVDRDRLLAVVEPFDLIGSPPADSPAARAGRLSGRISRPDADLATTWETMAALDRRRLAVVDSRGVLLGLLCLKRTGLGFCSDANVRSRAEDRSTVG